MAKAKQHHWDFAVKFRKNAYGWDGTAKAKANIVATLSELKAALKKSPALAAEGATIMLEKLVPSIQRIDSSSGGIGAAVSSAIPQLARLIAGGASDIGHYDRLERVFNAYQDDDMGYLDSLGDEFAAACGNTENASVWAERLLETTESAISQGVYFKGTSVCLGCLLATESYDELLALLAKGKSSIWADDIRGAKALAAQGKVDEGIAMARGGKPDAHLALGVVAFCEALLLEHGRVEEAYRSYGLLNQANNHLTTFRNLCKRYPSLEPQRILLDLIESTPGAEGKWFTSARQLGDLPTAVRLAQAGPCSPSTILRAVNDLREKHADISFELACAAIRGFALGWAYETDPAEVRSAREAAEELAKTAQQRDALKGLVAGFPRFFDS